jgi:Protein of unknown function (DUF2934)
MIEHLDEIRQRAHALWEREGRPEHRALDHWRQAEREIADERSAAPAKKAKAEKAPKAKAAKEPKAKRSANGRKNAEREPARA